MYIPPEFKITDETVIENFLREHNFGLLTTQFEDGFPLAAHLPFLMEKKENRYFFYTHLALQNELSRLPDGSMVLLVFTGAHGYVSSSWYGHPNVPTWNYMAVHINGKIRKQSSDELHNQLRKLTSLHEQSVNGRIHPDELPQTMIHGYLQHIVGFEVEATKIEAAFKLSQNRNEADFNSIINELELRNPALADAMKKFRK